jgi:hypothetical protein
MAQTSTPISAQFIFDVKLWRELNDQKAAVQTDMRKGQAKIKELKERIVSYMSDNTIDSVNVQGEKVKLIHTKSRQVLNEESLRQIIGAYYEEEEGVGDGEKSSKLAQFIVEKRAVTLKPTIRRLKKRAGAAEGGGAQSEEEEEEEEEQQVPSKRRKRNRRPQADEEDYDEDGTDDSNAAQSRLRA